MNAFRRIAKPWDIIIIVFLSLLSLVPFFIFSFTLAEKTPGNSINVAVISVGNLEIQRVILTDNMGMDILNIPEIDCSPDAIEINDDQIRIKGSTCPQQICVNRGYISKPGETIICLPHKMIIEIESTNEVDEDLIISLNYS